MGVAQSKTIYVEENGVNYDCPVCMLKDKPPNLLGRFYFINDKECQCNCCNTIFDKTLITTRLTSENLNKNSELLNNTE